MTRASDDELDAAGRAFAAGAAGEAALRDLCARYPDDPDPHFLLGAFLERAGRPADALGLLDRALHLDRDHEQALSARAAVLHVLGRDPEAQAMLREATARCPEVAQLWANLGVLLESGGALTAALEAYERAIALPDAPVGARMNRGYVLTRLGRFEEALANNQALAADRPDDCVAHYNVAEVLLALHRYAEAHEACDRAIAADRSYAKAHVDRALARAALGRVDAAQEDLDRARSLDPRAVANFNLGFVGRAGGILDEFGAYSIYFHLTYERLEQCDWSRRDELERSVAALASRSADSAGPISDPNIPFRTLGLDIDPSTRWLLARSIASRMQERAGDPSSIPRPARPRTRSRIRVGYVSPDYRTHPSAFLTRRLYQGHDRSRFEVFGYALAPSDGSRIASEVRSGFDAIRDMGRFGHAAIAGQIAADGIDILVDLAGYTNFSRSEIFALRPAPVQVNWLGYPGTLGASYMDYALVDRIVCPEGSDRFWTEKLVRLPNSYFITDSQPLTDEIGATRAGSGLPEQGFVFCCFNNAWKIEPRIFAVWMELLREVPDSVLWLLAFRPEVSVNLKREAAARGIDPARLLFGGRLPNESHLPRYRLADLFLDTLHYNAHTTAIEALREGTPVVTVAGGTMPSRVAASVLSAAGVPELICRNIDDYRMKALELARHPATLARIRAVLRESLGSAPLFDTARFIRNLETAFELMWERYLKGLPPQAFDVREIAPRVVPNRWF